MLFWKLSVLKELINYPKKGNCGTDRLKLNKSTWHQKGRATWVESNTITIMITTCIFFSFLLQFDVQLRYGTMCDRAISKSIT